MLTDEAELAALAALDDVDSTADDGEDWGEEDAAAGGKADDTLSLLEGLSTDSVREWTGRDCAKFVRNIGLPQYRESFETNLTGKRLMRMRQSHLPQMNITNFEHMKVIMKYVRQMQAIGERQAADEEESRRLLAEARRDELERSALDSLRVMF
eukprot:PLAT8532.1.p1 GENE.PLAT8532.1~~PLAT8532.1.p1  ORF type:complete len:154 (+),score=43.61 PLAT8532.1:45-506(+)